MCRFQIRECVDDVCCGGPLFENEDFFHAKALRPQRLGCLKGFYGL